MIRPLTCSLGLFVIFATTGQMSFAQTAQSKPAEATLSVEFYLENADPVRIERECEKFMATQGQKVTGVDCSKVLSIAKSFMPLTKAQQAQLVAIATTQSFDDDIDFQGLADKVDSVVPGFLDSLTQNGISIAPPDGARRITVGQRASTGARFVRP